MTLLAEWLPYLTNQFNQAPQQHDTTCKPWRAHSGHGGGQVSLPQPHDAVQALLLLLLQFLPPNHVHHLLLFLLVGVFWLKGGWGRVWGGTAGSGGGARNGGGASQCLWSPIFFLSRSRSRSRSRGDVEDRQTTRGKRREVPKHLIERVHLPLAPVKIISLVQHLLD